VVVSGAILRIGTRDGTLNDNDDVTLNDFVGSLSTLESYEIVGNNGHGHGRRKRDRERDDYRSPIDLTFPLTEATSATFQGRASG